MLELRKELRYEARSFADKNSPQKAVGVYKEQLQNFTKLPKWFLKDYLSLLLEFDEKQMAVELLESSIIDAPDKVSLYLPLVDILIQQKKFEKAFEYLNQYLTFDSGVELAYARIARINFRMNNFEEAYTNSKKAIALEFQPDWLKNIFNLSEKYLELRENNQQYLRALSDGKYDFIDLGTSRTLAGFELARKFGGTRGLGAELRPEVVAINTDAGHDVYWGDIRDLKGAKKSVSFSICSHVLEHLDKEEDMVSILEMLSGSCKDFIFIQGPNFDYDPYLRDEGLQWSHTCYDDHTYKFTTHDLSEVLKKIGFTRFMIGGQVPVQSSKDAWLLSKDQPPSKGNLLWSEGLLKKPIITFKETLYRNLTCVIPLNYNVEADEILSHAKTETILINYQA